MFPMHIEFLATGAIDTLKSFVTDQKVHPILVNFTAALVPVSVGADIVARVLKKESIRATAWWTLFIAACITPLTAIAGWLFWMEDDVGVTAMTIHKWLGTAMAVVLVGLVLWRWWAYRKERWPSFVYLCAGIVVVGALAYQGHLGGDQSFGSMEAASENTPAEPSPAPMRGMKMPQTRPDGLQWRDHIELKE
jgi:uncharacterized membrane protein